MKRSAALQEFSREHHRALVIANHIRRLDGDEAAGQAMLSQLNNSDFFDELASHFAAEEQQLGTALPHHPALAVRFVREHTELRRLMAGLRSGDGQLLGHFGQLLANHVRFEERELFGVLEATQEAIRVTPS